MSVLVIIVICRIFDRKDCTNIIQPRRLQSSLMTPRLRNAGIDDHAAQKFNNNNSIRKKSSFTDEQDL